MNLHPFNLARLVLSHTHTHTQSVRIAQPQKSASDKHQRKASLNIYVRGTRRESDGISTMKTHIYKRKLAQSKASVAAALHSGLSRLLLAGKWLFLPHLPCVMVWRRDKSLLSDWSKMVSSQKQEKKELKFLFSCLWTSLFKFNYTVRTCSEQKSSVESRHVIHMWSGGFYCRRRCCPLVSHLGMSKKYCKHIMKFIVLFRNLSNIYRISPSILIHLLLELRSPSVMIK